MGKEASATLRCGCGKRFKLGDTTRCPFCGSENEQMAIQNGGLGYIFHIDSFGTSPDKMPDGSDAESVPLDADIDPLDALMAAMPDVE